VRLSEAIVGTACLVYRRINLHHVGLESCCMGKKAVLI
jgi:hypothetical protein